MTELATFVDRHTMAYERTYAHPISLVFDAVSTGEHLDAWMVPTCVVERRLGGACSFTWGGPAGEPVAVGVVSVWEPPTAVQYTFQDGSWLRFDLSSIAHDSATSLRFTMHFLPDPSAVDDDFTGGDHPVPGTAWQPGFLAGFHEMLDDLHGFLAGTHTREDNVRWLEEFVANGPGEEHERLCDVYRDHVRAHCPPEA